MGALTDALANHSNDKNEVLTVVIEDTSVSRAFLVVPIFFFKIKTGGMNGKDRHVMPAT